jgi:hypothetical protein
MSAAFFQNLKVSIGEITQLTIDQTSKKHGVAHRKFPLIDTLLYPTNQAMEKSNLDTTLSIPEINFGAAPKAPKSNSTYLEPA